MILHGIMVLFELINFYVTITDDDTIDINDLEEAYNILTTKMINIEQAKLDHNFNDTLNNLLDNYSDYLYLDNDNLIIGDDLTILYDEIASNITISCNDDILQEMVLDTRIFDILDIPVPLEEYENIFNINKEITNTYKLIAQDETNNILNIINIIYLKQLIKKLNDKVCCLTILDDIKIKMCIAHFNKILNDDTYSNENFGWYIALFNDDLLSVLDYDRTSYLVDEVDVIDDDTDEDNEDIIKNNHQTINNLNMFNYENTYFLASLFLQINNYLKQDLPYNIKQKLTLKKYLFLSTPDLKNMEDYFLKHYNFDNMNLPEFTNYEPKDRFSTLHNDTLKCILNLDYQDKEINDDIYTKIIISLLFIKNYLELSLNKTRNEEIINTIIYSKFYQNHNYSIVNNLLNTLIFNNSQNKRR